MPADIPKVYKKKNTWAALQFIAAIAIDPIQFPPQNGNQTRFSDMKLKFPNGSEGTACFISNFFLWASRT